MATAELCREATLDDLRNIIQHGLPYALSRWLSPDNFDASGRQRVSLASLNSALGA